jgi:hypothetical protein
VEGIRKKEGTTLGSEEEEERGWEGEGEEREGEGGELSGWMVRGHANSPTMKERRGRREKARKMDL